MAFRSDLAASQARLTTLEEENRQLAEELARERAQRPKPPSRVAFSVVVLFASLLALSAGAVTLVLVAHPKPAPATPPPPDEVPIQISEPSPPPPLPTKDLVVEDLRLGTGATPKKGDTLKVHYTGKLPSGVTFDTSYSRNAPFTFRYGEGQVIKGWEQGFAGMRIGGKRRLTIPSHLAYGTRGAPPQIPPNATLIFEIELLGIEPTPH